MVQAVGFWWTCAARALARPGRAARRRRRPARRRIRPDLRRAGRRRRADDRRRHAHARAPACACRCSTTATATTMRGWRPALGAGYVRRRQHHGAKAGNINHALRRCDAPFVVVLDCDHVPDERFLEATLGHFADERVAFVQTPQYYANAGASDARRRGLEPAGAVLRRRSPAARTATTRCSAAAPTSSSAATRSTTSAASRRARSPRTSSCRCACTSAAGAAPTCPRSLARGLGPEDIASYVGQQHRWARGCLSAPSAASCAPACRCASASSTCCRASYFLTGWTVLVYMAFPVVRILTGAQPLAASAADQFLVHFAPYFGLALYLVALHGRRASTASAPSRCRPRRSGSTSTPRWRSLLRRTGTFKVTPKRGAEGAQPRTVVPALAVIALLLAVSAYGLCTGATRARSTTSPSRSCT